MQLVIELQKEKIDRLVLGKECLGSKEKEEKDPNRGKRSQLPFGIEE